MTKLFEGKRILITGHTGFKGSWLSQWLLKLGGQVCGYSLSVPTQPSHFELLQLQKHMHDHRGDLRDFERMKRVFDQFRPEIVFHLAAQPLVRPSYDDPKTTFDTNVGGTVNLLEILRTSPSVRSAVLIATDKCYENIETLKGYKESDPLGGKDPYSASKACTEIAFLSYQRSFFHLRGDLGVASARAGNVIGGGDWAQDRLIPDCVRAWSKNETVQIRNPDAVRPWQHVLEPLSGYLRLAEELWNHNPQVCGEPFNFGPREDSTQKVSSVLEEMKRNWPEARSEIDPSGIGNKKEAGLLVLNCQKAHDVLKWAPKLDFNEAIKLTADWYQAHAHQQLMLDWTLKQIHDYERRL